MGLDIPIACASKKSVLKDSYAKEFFRRAAQYNRNALNYSQSTNDPWLAFGLRMGETYKGVLCNTYGSMYHDLFGVNDYLDLIPKSLEDEDWRTDNKAESALNLALFIQTRLGQAGHLFEIRPVDAKVMSSST